MIAATCHLPHLRGDDRVLRDSPLKGTGFEPSVHRKAPGVVLVSVLVRVDFSVSGESSGGDVSPSRNLGYDTRYRRFASRFLQRRVLSKLREWLQKSLLYRQLHSPAAPRC